MTDDASQSNEFDSAGSPASGEARERHARIKRLFDELWALEASDRSQRLGELRAEDAELAEAVEVLLHLDSQESSPLDHRTGFGQPTPTRPERLGEFRILEELGRGGMGVVWLAEQDRPKRRVALKVLRPGLMQADSLSRFAREAEVLGRLNHPSIAHVFEAGTAESGGEEQAYLAMELIEGQKLTEWAAGKNLRERIEVLATIADAVHHAHSQGVVHRDLKPSNILVTSEGTPKVLDFGVARVLDSEPGAATAMTHTGDVIGTLQYMSPEQVQGQASGVGPPSDVYSLGAIAYELLSNRRPYDASGMPVHQAAQLIVETEPSRLGKLDTRLAGDLETIISKALEKETSRRYSSARALSEDLRRYLDDLPILARPMTRVYRARKFARRNRALVLGVVAVIAALSAGVVGMAWKAREASRSALQAKARMTRAVEVSRLLTDFFSSVDPELEGPDARILNMMDRSEAILTDDTSRAPLVRAAMHEAIGRAYKGLGDLRKAEQHVRLGLTLREANDAEPWELAESLESLGFTLKQVGGQDPAETRKLYRRVLDLRRQSLGPQDRSTLGAELQLLNFDWEFGDRTGVLDEMRRVLGLLESIEPPGSTFILACRNTLALNAMQAGLLEEAEALQLRSLEEVRSQVGENHLRTAGVQADLGRLYYEMGRPEEALTFAQASLATREARLPSGHPDIARSLQALSAPLAYLGRGAEAIPLIEREVEIARSLRDKPGRSLLAPLMSLASILLQEGDVDGASKALDEAEQLADPEDGAMLEERVQLLEAQGIVASWRGDLNSALEKQQLANQLRQENSSPNKPDLASGLYNEGSILRRLGRMEEALVPLTKAYELELEVRGPLHSYTAQARHELAHALYALGELESALQHASGAYESMLEMFGEASDRTGFTAQLLGMTYYKLDRTQEALDYFEKASVGLVEGFPALDIATRRSSALTKLGRASESIALLEPLYQTVRAEGRLTGRISNRLCASLIEAYRAVGDEQSAAEVRAAMDAAKDN